MQVVFWIEFEFHVNEERENCKKDCNKSSSVNKLI